MGDASTGARRPIASRIFKQFFGDVLVVFYFGPMQNTPPSAANKSATFDLKLGRSLEAHATGWGVLAVPIVLALLLLAGLLGLLWR
jgi:hypothetical protein